MNFRLLAASALLAGVPAVTWAKPIAFARGTTLMAEYGAGTMNEFQAFHAPRYWWSLGASWLQLHSDDGRIRRDLALARVNLLAKRWNLPSAQANVFAWGGLGRASGSDFAGSTLARNIGFQADYETRRIYSALRSDLQESPYYSHRIDTLQLGWAPYAHDYDSTAVWFVLQARRYTGHLVDGSETALLLRVFKRNTWVEAGVTRDGKLQAMAMFNF